MTYKVLVFGGFLCGVILLIIGTFNKDIYTLNFGGFMMIAHSLNFYLGGK